MDSGWDDTYPTILTLETLGLPDGHVDGVDAVADTGDKSRDDHLDSLCGGSLKNGANHHDPAAPHDTAFTAPSIGGHECEDSAEEAS